MSSVLVLGGSGLVGSYLIKRLSKNHTVVATYDRNKVGIQGVEWVRFHYPADSGKLESILHRIRPDAVVNTIAYASVDFCETNKADAYALHVTLIEDVCRIANGMGSKVIHSSTDYVYDGKKKLYSEEDTPKPLSYYGLTKLLAERIAVSSSNKNLVLRPALIYGWHPKSRFLNFVLSALTAQKEFEAYSDQYSCPTLVDDLVECVSRGIESSVAGIFNTVGSSCVNRFEFAKAIAKAFGLDPNLVKPILTSKSPQTALRPMLNCVDNTKAASAFNFKFSSIDEGMTRVFEEANKGN